MKTREYGKHGLFAYLFWRVALQYKKMLIDIGKLHAAKLYVQSVSGLRRAAVTMVVAMVFTAIAMIGFLFIHAGIVLACEWTLRQAALFLLICGGVYLAVSAGVLMYLVSSKLWARKFKVNEVLDKAMHD